MGIGLTKQREQREEQAVDIAYTGPNWHQCEANGCPNEGSFFGASGVVCFYHANAAVVDWPSITDCVKKTEQLRALADLWTVASLHEDINMGDDREDLWAICDAFNIEAERCINSNLRKANEQIKQRNELRAARPDGGEPEREWPLIPQVPHSKYGPGFYLLSPPYILSAWTTAMSTEISRRRVTKSSDVGVPRKAFVDEMLGRIARRAKVFYRGQAAPAQRQPVEQLEAF